MTSNMQFFKYLFTLQGDELHYNKWGGVICLKNIPGDFDELSGSAIRSLGGQ